MYIIKLNFFVNSKFERLEIWVNEKESEDIMKFRNNEELDKKLITISGSGTWFAAKDILYIEEVDKGPTFYSSLAPKYYYDNLEKLEKIIRASEKK